MTLITSDGGVLYVYEAKKLVWSAKLPFIPVCLSRGSIYVSINISEFVFVTVYLADIKIRFCFLGEWIISAVIRTWRLAMLLLGYKTLFIRRSSSRKFYNFFQEYEL